MNIPTFQSEDMIGTVESVLSAPDMWSQCLTLLSDTLLLYHSNNYTLSSRVRTVAKRLLDTNISSLSGRLTKLNNII